MEFLIADIDTLAFGHRVRHFRKQRGMTLDDLSARVQRPAPFLSQLENGKREPKLGLITAIAEALGVAAADLLDPEPPNRRAALEIAVERAQEHHGYRQLGLPHLKPSARVPDAALEHIVALFDVVRGRTEAPVATREEARAVNAELRQEMRARHNYFDHIEALAGDALSAVAYGGTGPLSEANMRDLAGHFGFTVHRAQDVPISVRSVTDLRNRRIYIPQRDHLGVREARSVVLQTIGHFALEHRDPVDFGEFLRQRVEANYFAGAVLMPEGAAAPFLAAAMERRDISVEDVREVFYVSYEMAAHRFMNLATEHLGLEVHFLRSDQNGIIWKAYENNGVPFPRNGQGAVEGQRLCREWGTRQAYQSEDKFSIHYQYTDTSSGSFWCATHVEAGREPLSAVTTGVRFEDARYFRGRDTDRHSVSKCPDGDCCRRPPIELSTTWDGHAWPSARPNSHVLAAMPVETIPGVDTTEIYEFLEANAP